MSHSRTSFVVFSALTPPHSALRFLLRCLSEVSTPSTGVNPYRSSPSSRAGVVVCVLGVARTLLTSRLLRCPRRCRVVDASLFSLLSNPSLENVDVSCERGETTRGSPTYGAWSELRLPLNMPRPAEHAFPMTCDTKACVPACKLCNTSENDARMRLPILGAPPKPSLTRALMGTILLIAAILLIAIPLEAWSTLEVSLIRGRRILLAKKYEAGRVM